MTLLGDYSGNKITHTVGLEDSYNNYERSPNSPRLRFLIEALIVVPIVYLILALLQAVYIFLQLIADVFNFYNKPIQETASEFVDNLSYLIILPFMLLLLELNAIMGLFCPNIVTHCYEEGKENLKNKYYVYKKFLTSSNNSEFIINNIDTEFINTDIEEFKSPS